MPKPQKDETRDAFLERCIPQLVDEGKDQDQATAICNSMWERRDTKETLCLNGFSLKEETDGQKVYTGLIATTHPDRVGDILSVDSLKQMVEYINDKGRVGDDSGSYRSVSLYHDWINKSDPTLDEAGFLKPNARLIELDDGHYGVEVDAVVNKYYKGDMEPEEIEYRLENGGIAGFSIEFMEGDTKTVEHGGESFNFIDSIESFGGVGFARPRMIANPYAVVYKEIQAKAKEKTNNDIGEQPENTEGDGNMTEEQTEQTQEAEQKEAGSQTSEEQGSKEQEPQETQSSNESENETQVEQQSQKESLNDEQVVDKILNSERFKEALANVDMKSKTVKKTKEDDKMSNVPFSIKEMDKQIQKQNDPESEGGLNKLSYKEAAKKYFQENPNIEKEMETRGVPLRSTLTVKSDGNKLRIVDNFSTKADTLDRDTNSEGTYGISAVELADVFQPTIIESFNQQTNFFGALPKRDHLEGTSHYGWRIKTDQSSSLAVDPDSKTVSEDAVNKEKLRTEIKVYRVGVSVNDYIEYHSRLGAPTLLMNEAELRMDDLMKDINKDLFAEQADSGNNVLGLKAVSDATGNSTLYGKTRTTSNRLKAGDGKTYTTSTGTLDTAAMRDAIDKVESEGAFRGDMRIVASPANRTRLFELQDSKQDLTLSPQFGFSGQIAFDGIPVIVDSDCPDESVFVVDFASEYIVVSKAPQMVGTAKTDASESAYVETYLAHVYELPRRIHEKDGITG